MLEPPPLAGQAARRRLPFEFFGRPWASKQGFDAGNPCIHPVGVSIEPGFFGRSLFSAGQSLGKFGA